jgi:hypothetical protein
LPGRSWGPSPFGNAYGYATVAYASTGITLWTNRYHGPANSWDGANAVATDTAGNVFVTGYSSGTGTSFDFTTVSYSASGAAMWTNR